MQFTHEATVTIETPLRDVRAHWTGPDALCGRLSHIRATAPGPAADLACLVICLDGRDLEFAVQRTMCTDETVCWQSLGETFLYVLTVCLQDGKTGGAQITVTVAYDPPGFLYDIAESLGWHKGFQRDLDRDLARYARALRHQFSTAFTRVG
jgi:uncharacterized membrane protein